MICETEATIFLFGDMGKKKGREHRKQMCIAL